jgi:hypothetical protein
MSAEIPPPTASAAVESTVAAESSTPVSTYQKGISPIKPEYLLPKPAAKEESIAHLSEAIEAEGDQGRTEADNNTPEVNENNKRDRKDVCYTSADLGLYTINHSQHQHNTDSRLPHLLLETCQEQQEKTWRWTEPGSCCYASHRR